MKSKNIDDWVAWLECDKAKLSVSLRHLLAHQVLKTFDLTSFPIPVIKIAGTNGKGSCAAALEAIYLASGYSVGVLTSPHLIHINERIRVDGKNISDAVFCDGLERISQINYSECLGYALCISLVALSVFKEQKLDVIILETGIGGRLSVENLVTSDVNIITSIDLDHQDLLGANREIISLEKAYIMSAGVPAVCGENMPNKLIKHAQVKRAPLFCLEKDFSYEKCGATWQFDEMKELPQPNILLSNAALALQSVKLLQEQLPTTQASIESGLSNIKHDGRLQWCPGDVPCLLDVAHNVASVAVLRNFILSKKISGKVHALFAMSEVKQVRDCVKMMDTIVDSWTISQTSRNDLAKEDIYQDIFRTLGREYRYFDKLNESFEDVMEHANSEDLIVVFGSFYLVGEVLILPEFRYAYQHVHN